MAKHWKAAAVQRGDVDGSALIGSSGCQSALIITQDWQLETIHIRRERNFLNCDKGKLDVAQRRLLIGELVSMGLCCIDCFLFIPVFYETFLYHTFASTS